MPSLLAHIFLGIFLAYVFRVKKKSMLLFGAILPDIKIFLYLLATPLLGLSAANMLIVPVHSLFGSLLLALFFASLLPKDEYGRNLLLLCLGAAAHFTLDASIYPFYGIEHYLLLYPLSWSTYGIAAMDYIYSINMLGLFFLAAVMLADYIKRGERIVY
ncbi:MAG: hypothetical protein WAX07_08085 [Candidatus Altiarchaeia archaeon]